MTAYAARFPILSRLLHWLMAAMILAMLFIGIGMVATVSKRYELLVSIHRPLGIAILILVVVRLVNRCLNPPPALPDTVPPVQRWAAKASHIVLYASMVAMPLVGWGMLSAERYPIVLYRPLQLPSILPHNVALYAWLRSLHTYLAYLLFFTFLAHFGAALFHGLIRRDGVFESMASWRTGHGNEADPSWDPHTPGRGRSCTDQRLEAAPWRYDRGMTAEESHENKRDQE